MTCTCEMPWEIGSWFAESRPRNAKENETENESCLTSQEDQFKGNFLLPLIDHAICCLINRFEQMYKVGAIFHFLYNQESLSKLA